MFVRSEVSGVRSSWPASAMSCDWRSREVAREPVMELNDRESRAISSSPSTGIRTVRSSVRATCSTACGEVVDGAQAGTGDPQAGRARADDTDAGDEDQDRARAW